MSFSGNHMCAHVVVANNMDHGSSKDPLSLRGFYLREP